MIKRPKTAPQPQTRPTPLIDRALRDVAGGASDGSWDIQINGKGK
jgi:hypothetical protein